MPSEQSTQEPQADMYHYAKVKQVAELYKVVDGKLEPTGESVEICGSERCATVVCRQGSWHIKLLTNELGKAVVK